MNKTRRSALGKIVTELEEIKSKLEPIAEEEREAYDNLTENAQDGDRGLKICENADALEEALDILDGLINDIGGTTKE